MMKQKLPRDEEFIEMLDKKMATLTEEMKALQPAINHHKLLTNQINALLRLKNEFEKEGA